MLISDFARQAGLSVDTVRFYIRRGLLTPDVSAKGGANPYQIFTPAHLEVARMVKVAQSLGFSLKDIAQLADKYRADALTPERTTLLLQGQIAQLEAKAAQLAAMIAFMRAKLDWVGQGSTGPAPDFQHFVAGL